MTNRKWDVFLSYHGSDRLEARQIVEMLSTAGLNVWFDQRSITAGDAWRQAIEEAIGKVRVFVVFLTDRAPQGWVQAEVKVALTQQARLHREVKESEHVFRIVPLVVEGFDPGKLDPSLGSFQCFVLPADRALWPSKMAALVEQIRLGFSGAREISAHTSGPEVKPFPGLQYFDEDQAHFFFGRSQEIEECLARWGRTGGGYRRWLQIYGPSGAGKSSLARAGLVPSVRQSRLPGGPERWCVAVVRPGNQPLENLADAVVKAMSPVVPDTSLFRNDIDYLRGGQTSLRRILRHTPAGFGFLLVIDQLEEVFTLRVDAAERGRFDEQLIGVLNDVDGPVHLLTTIRADFVAQFDQLPGLANALNSQASHYFLKPMDAQRLLSAVTGPLRLAGLSWDGDLPERLVAEVEGNEGALPLLSHVLEALWSQRTSDGRLTLEAYNRLNGVGGALCREADAIVDSLSPEDQEGARRAFLALVQIGRGRKDAAQPCPRKRLLTIINGQHPDLVLARLSGGKDPAAPSVAKAPARLLIVSQSEGPDPEGGRVDLIHEALLDHWLRLRSWIDASRRALELRDDLNAAVRVWKSAGCSKDALPRDSQLTYYEGQNLDDFQAQSYRSCLDDDASEFLKSAQSLRSRKRFVLGGGLFASAVAVVLLMIWWHQINEQRNRIMESRLLSLSATSLLETQPELARLLSIEAVHKADTFEARKSLLTAVQARQLHNLHGHQGWVSAVAFSPDGSVLASAGQDGLIRLWAYMRGELARELTHNNHEKEWVSAIAFSSVGSYLASAGESGSVQVWDLNNGFSTRELRGEAGRVSALSFSPDGSMLAAAGADGTVRLWDLESPLALGQPLLGHNGWVSALSFSPDGSALASAGDDRTIRLWNPKTGQLLYKPLKGHTGGVLALCFGPHSSVLASAGEDRTVRLWDSRTGQPIGRSLEGHQDWVSSVAFSPDGSVLASAGWDHFVRFWNPKTGQPFEEPLNCGGRLTDVAFSPDGLRLASAGEDGIVRLWDTQTSQPQLRLIQGGHPDWINSVEFTPDGLRLASAGEDGFVRLRNPTTGQLSAEYSQSPGKWIADIAFSPDGSALASVGEGGTVLRDLKTGRLNLLQSGLQVYAVAFSPDGSMLASTGEGGALNLWDPTGLPLGQPLNVNGEGVSAIAFSPDSSSLASAGEAGTIRLWNPTNGQLMKTFMKGNERRIFALAFSPDGSILASAGEDRTVNLWNTHRGMQILQPLDGHKGWISALAFSPNGSLLASAGGDRVVLLWDVETGQPLGHPFRGHAGWVSAVAFSPDGSILASAGEDQTIRFWNVDLAAWAAEACRRANRSLTELEWREYFPHEAYRRSCEIPMGEQGSSSR